MKISKNWIKSYIILAFCMFLQTAHSGEYVLPEVVQKWTNPSKCLHLKDNPMLPGGRHFCYPDHGNLPSAIPEVLKAKGSNVEGYKKGEFLLTEVFDYLRYYASVCETFQVVQLLEGKLENKELNLPYVDTFVVTEEVNEVSLFINSSPTSIGGGVIVAFPKRNWCLSWTEIFKELEVIDQMWDQMSLEVENDEDSLASLALIDRFTFYQVKYGSKGKLLYLPVGYTIYKESPRRKECSKEPGFKEIKNLVSKSKEVIDPVIGNYLEGELKKIDDIDYEFIVKLSSEGEPVSILTLGNHEYTFSELFEDQNEIMERHGISSAEFDSLMASKMMVESSYAFDYANQLREKGEISNGETVEIDLQGNFVTVDLPDDCSFNSATGLIGGDTCNALQHTSGNPNPNIK